MSFDSWYKKNKDKLDRLSALDRLKFAFEASDDKFDEAGYTRAIEERRRIWNQRWPDEPFDPYR